MENEYTWNLTPLAASDTDPALQQERQAVTSAVQAFVTTWKPREDYLHDPIILRQALDQYEAIYARYDTDGNEGYYFHLRLSQDQNNPTLKGLAQQAEDSATALQNELQFFDLALAKVPQEQQHIFLTSTELALYHHYLERLFAESPHLLSEEAEKILNLKSSPAYANWVRMTSGLLAKQQSPLLQEDGTEKVGTFEEALSLTMSQNKAVRDGAAEVVNSMVLTQRDAAEAEINAVLLDKKINDELRGFPYPESARLLSDDIQREVVESLCQSVTNHFSIAGDFYHLKAQLLGQEKLAYHERNVAYGELNQKYSYDQATELVSRTLFNLDPEFGQIFTGYMSNGQIDVYPRPGKHGGAFCAHHTPAQPTYILLNHTDQLQDVLTLAHETGHGINNELIKQKRHGLDFGTSLATAEVASTFMEDFVLRELRTEADDTARLALNMLKLNDDISTIFRQVAAYRFEQELHHVFRQRRFVSADEIGQIFQKHMSAYMGEYIEQSPGSENWWIYWSHIRSFFYVYSYASGLLISKAMQAKVHESRDFISSVKQFLSVGQSASPQQSFSEMGIDITNSSFWDQGLQEVATLLKETTELAQKLGKV